MNSKLIDVSGTPKLPDIGYYNEKGGVDEFLLSNPHTTSYPALKENISKSCTNIKNDGIYTQDNIIDNELYKHYPKDYINKYSGKTYDELNMPYYLYKSDSVSANGHNNINTAISGLAGDVTINRIANQIQHLVCQLITARNRYYNPDDFPFFVDYSTVESIFYGLGPSMVWPLIIIFFITMYFIVSGLFDSIDLGANIINCVQKTKTTGISYWIGILTGLVIFSVILIPSYQKSISDNLNQSSKDNITHNPYGIQHTITAEKRRLDYTILSIFILIIFGLIALLFTIKKESFNNFIYTGLVTFIMLIITVFIYMMYSYIPFFNTGDPDKINSILPEPLQLFIDKKDPNINEDVSKIESNQKNEKSLRVNFLITAIVIFILSIVFFKFGCKKNSSGITEVFKPANFITNIFNAILGASSILILPILWVFNIILAIKYFYIYPIILIMLRFLRYAMMMFIYMSYKDNDQSGLSNDMRKIINNFKNYSASWGLIGVEELKIIMGLNGFDNIFSDYVINGKSNSVDISDNKFVSSGLLGFFVQGNVKGIIVSSIYFILTCIITSIILFGIVNVQKIFKM
jgi:hypothetical protein